MQKSGYLNLDGHLLRLLVMVHDTRSVTDVARQLGVNQSTVSHGLERLRAIVGDPLFVRSGRGITPTARADQLADRARSMLAELEGLAENPDYDPADDDGLFTIAANDYEVETILKPLLMHMRSHAPGADLHIMRATTRTEWADLLRRRDVDLVLAPPLGSAENDLAQQVLFQDHHLCVYDPDHQQAPDTLDAYCAAPHAVMQPGRAAPTDIDQQLTGLGRNRRVVASAPGFSMLATLISGTDIIATMPSRLSRTLFRTCAHVSPPLEVPGFSIAQIWHVRNAASPRHQWLRQAVRTISQKTA